jgi:glycosyltransferase involved in cell wall biosynthesis
MKKMPLPISVAIIARNEEENLKRLLPNITGFAEEIILVHNDCHDDTVRIAKDHSVRCFNEIWHGYKEQKNLAIQKCTKKWILCMDADEVLSDKLKQSISDFLLDSGENKFSGASFNRCSFFMGKWIRHGDWYPDKKNRLLRATMGVWEGGEVHEHLVIGGEVCHLKGDLLHYSYDSILELPQKMSVYAKQFARQRMKNEKKVSNLQILVRPIWRFFRAYFFRLGFLDGLPGLIIASSSSYECMLKYVYHRELAISIHD